VFIEKLGVWVKLENMQYTGSIKVRPAYFMLMQAMRQGILHKGGTFVEASSGNTAIAMAHIAPLLGLTFIAVLPKHASAERKAILRYLGADVVEVEGDDVIGFAKELADEKGYFYVGQHYNRYNPIAHEITTGPEALRDLPDVPDAITIGVGTGGTITGLARFFKKFRQDILVVGIRPQAMGSLIEGISLHYLPAYDNNVVDYEVTVYDEEIKEFHSYLAKQFGLFVGYSAAANIYVAHQLRLEKKLDIVFTVAPDGGDRYVSTLM